MAAAVDIKTGKPVDNKATTHMTVTWQSVLALAVVGMIIGLIFAATRKGENKGYALYAGVFAVFGALAAAGAQVLDVKAIGSKAAAPVPAAAAAKPAAAA